ncbi:MAG TPA: hypothetical protein VMW46_09545 [Candidatus Desulfaltia sp.]|nr:hypothetical protein [Candidatus Desulfaltia sp.]
MVESDTDVLNTQLNEQLDRSREIADSLRCKNAIGLQGNMRSLQDLGDDRNEETETPTFSGDILSQTVKAQKERKLVVPQEIQYIISEEAAVRGERVMRFDARVFGQSFDLLDSLSDRIKGQKGLSAVEINVAFPGKKGIKKIKGPDQDSRIQPPPPLFRIAIDAIEIAMICQYDGETG